MKTLNSILLASAAAMGCVNFAQATVLLSDTFSYNNGDLVGQGLWGQTGTASNNPVQVSNGNVVLGTGQDVYKALSSPQTLSTVGALYFSLDLSISSASAAGDYFFHVTPTVADSSLFFGRLSAKSAPGGYVLGFLDTSGGTFTYGSPVLSFSTDYQIIVAWTSVAAGTANDTFKLYVDPISGTESANTAYLSHTWTSASVEPLTVAAVNFRQGGSTSAPATTVREVVVATTFLEASGIAASPVPEPSTYAAILGGVALVGAMSTRRRRA